MWYFIHLFVLCGILLCFTIIFCSIFHYSSLSCRTDKKVIERSQKNACLAHETLVQPCCLEFQYFISKIVRIKLTLLNGSDKKTFLKQSTVTGTQSMVAPRYLKNNCVLVYKHFFFKQVLHVSQHYSLVLFIFISYSVTWPIADAPCVVVKLNF